jgi:hypothetical protein
MGAGRGGAGRGVPTAIHIQLFTVRLFSESRAASHSKTHQCSLKSRVACRTLSTAFSPDSTVTTLLPKRSTWSLHTLIWWISSGGFLLVDFSPNYLRQASPVRGKYFAYLPFFPQRTPPTIIPPPLTTESPTTHYCTVQHHVPIDPYAERMLRAVLTRLYPAHHDERNVHNGAAIRRLALGPHTA